MSVSSCALLPCHLRTAISEARYLPFRSIVLVAVRDIIGAQDKACQAEDCACCRFCRASKPGHTIPCERWHNVTDAIEPHNCELTPQPQHEQSPPDFGAATQHAKLLAESQSAG